MEKKTDKELAREIRIASRVADLALLIYNIYPVSYDEAFEKARKTVLHNLELGEYSCDL